MLRDLSPLSQSLLGTGFTWLVTATGAACVFVLRSPNQKLLDYSLGFGAGVMTAASFWSLLEPAFKSAAQQAHLYGESGRFAFLPITFGFLVGGLFVYAADLLLPSITSRQVFNSVAQNKRKHDENSIEVKTLAMNGDVRARLKRNLTLGVNSKRAVVEHIPVGDSPMEEVKNFSPENNQARWHRLLLLIIAVTVHNFPEGMAVGVAFGSIPSSNNATASFHNARNLALGIGIQNFPEGLAISLPLRSFGMGAFRAFWYGQLSGLVEILAGILGVLFVQLANSLLPFALSFAAGAMLFVVFNEIIPEISSPNRTMSSWWVMCGFVVMMILDVACS